MTEPVYEYVKGQGWVVTSFPVHVFVCNGYTVRAEARPPQEGEYAASSYNTDYDFCPGGVINFSQWEKWFIQCWGVSPFPEDKTTTYERNRNRKELAWVTFVKV